jgi:hypothetical protein
LIRIAAFFSFFGGSIGLLWSTLALWVWAVDVDPRVIGLAQDLLGWGLLHMTMIGVVVAVQSLRSGVALLGAERRAGRLVDAAAGWSLGLGVLTLVEVLGILQVRLPVSGAMGLALLAYPVLATAIGALLQVAGRALPSPTSSPR